MTATTTTTAERSEGPSGRDAMLERQALRELAFSARIRAEELVIRSAAVLTRAGDLYLEVALRPALGESRVRRRLETAETRIVHLERALVSNRRIGMALGVLMARRGLTEVQAFDLLRGESSRRNVKLAVLAEEVVYTGDL